MSDVESIIEQVERKSGLPSAPSEEFLEEARTILQYDRNTLEAMSAEECGYAAQTISRYILFIINTINRAKARVHWYEHELNQELGTFSDKEFGHIYGAEPKKWAAIMSRQSTIDLSDKIQTTKTTLARLYDVVDPIKLLREDILSIKYAKLARQKLEN
jgi:hypothetical protein